MENNKYFDEYVFEGPVTGSGGGCFTHNQKVFTSNGWKPISKLHKGDLVIAFDRDGTLDHGVIVETFKHSKEENNSGIFTFVWECGQLEVTGNHAIYFDNGTDTPFKQAQDFVVGDLITDDKGDVYPILEISQREIEEDEFTYNLNVIPQHTYIIEGMRVHNGGGGKSSGGAQEDPNTLRSTQIARVMEVISEGPIWGLTTNSLQSVFFNDTPVQNSDNSYNFSIKQGDFRTGIPSQDYVTGFNGVESVMSVNSQVSTTTSISRSIQATSDAISVQIRLPSGLFIQDTSTGDMSGGEVQLALDSRPTGGTWTEIMSPTIKGKTTSTYDTSYRINRPTGATTWEVRVRRITADSAASTTVNRTDVYQITEIQEVKLAYNGVAYAAVALDAESVGNSIPVRSYDVKGIICPIPNNYNPITRVYTGTWSGTFTYAWTDNPAWILYDLLTNTTYGMGSFIDVDTIDVWSFYAASQYNDTLVSDGSGGTEPRFTFNYAISTREEGWKLIQAIASTMRAVVIPGGIITLVQDRPSTPVKIVTNSNVKDGMFNYTSSGLLARHTAVNVTFFDKNNRYLPKIVSESDSTGINRYGYNLAEVSAYGCTSEGQARRVAKWFLDTEMHQLETISYETGFNQADLVPGDIIYVMDNDYTNEVFAGRIAGGTTTAVITDAPVTLNPGATYTLTLLDLDGSTIVSRTITNTAGTYTTFNLSSALTNPAETLKGREWMITSASDVSARQFKVVGMKESEKGVFAITAVFHDPDKYARVESGLTNPDDVYEGIETATCDPVTNIVGTFETSIDPVKGTVVNLRIDWTKPTSSNISGYKVSWNKNNGLMSQTQNITNNSFLIENVTGGDYYVQVIAYNIKNVQSAPATAILTMDYASATPSALDPVTNLQLTIGGTASSSPDFNIRWTNPATNNNTDAVLKDFMVVVYNGATPKRTEYINAVAAGAYGYYNYTYSDNQADNSGTAIRTIIVKVYARDTLNRTSVVTTATFANAAPAAPTSIVITPAYETTTITTSAASTPSDFAGMLIWASTTNGFTPSSTNLVYQGPSKMAFISTPSNTLMYYRIAWYDTFGVQGAIVSAQQSSTTTSVANTNEYQLVGVTWTPNSPSTNKVAWTTCTAHKINGLPAMTAKTITASNATWTSGILYIYYVEGNTTLSSSTVITDAVGSNKMIVATYRGGTLLEYGDGQAYMDGSFLIAGTVAGSKIVAGDINATHIAAGSITAASGIIANAAITNAKIGDAEVSTLKLEGEAVTMPRSATTGSSWYAIAYPTSWTPLTTPSITTIAGQSVVCMYTIDVSVIGGDGSGSANFEIWRNTTSVPSGTNLSKPGGSTTVTGSVKYISINAASHTVTAMAIDTPGAGTYTYSVVGQGAASVVGRHATIVLLGTKR